MVNNSRPIRTSVAIQVDDYEWLKRHPQYSISGLLTWAIKTHRAMEKKAQQDF
jgi:hypothetical protein